MTRTAGGAGFVGLGQTAWGSGSGTWAGGGAAAAADAWDVTVQLPAHRYDEYSFTGTVDVHPTPQVRGPAGATSTPAGPMPPHDALGVFGSALQGKNGAFPSQLSKSRPDISKRVAAVHLARHRGDGARPETPPPINSPPRLCRITLLTCPVSCRRAQVTDGGQQFQFCAVGYDLQPVPLTVIHHERYGL